MENCGNGGLEENCTSTRAAQETQGEEGGGRKGKQTKRRRLTGIR
jgi:hypothetical protein